MRVGLVLFSAALGLLLASGTPLKRPAKPVSLSLHRHFLAYQSEDTQGQLPLKVNGIESLVYTVDVQVGGYCAVRKKGFVASDRSCSKGDAQRNLIDPSLSKSFRATSIGLAGWDLSEYPYVGLECHQNIAKGQTYDGVWAHDTYQFGDVSVPGMSFVLANHTYYPLNPRWASDGVLALDTDSGVGPDDLQKTFDTFGGGHEVSLLLNKDILAYYIEAYKHGVSVPRLVVLRCTSACSESASVIVGSHSIKSGDFAELSTSAPFLEVPPRYFRPVVNALGGTFDDDLDLYTVDCSSVDSLSEISFDMSSGFGLVYTVKAHDYVTKINGNNGVQCALLIVQSDDGWVVGTQFLPNRCMHLDYATGEIGFADPKN